MFNSFKSYMVQRFNIVIEQGEDGYLISDVVELPGCHTQAKTMDELLERTKEAISTLRANSFSIASFISFKMLNSVLLSKIISGNFAGFFKIVGIILALSAFCLLSIEAFIIFFMSRVFSNCFWSFLHKLNFHGSATKRVSLFGFILTKDNTVKTSVLA